LVGWVVWSRLSPSRKDDLGSGSLISQERPQSQELRRVPRLGQDQLEGLQGHDDAQRSLKKCDFKIIVLRFRDKASRVSQLCFLAETVLAETVVRKVHSCRVYACITILSHERLSCPQFTRRWQTGNISARATHIYTPTKSTPGVSIVHLYST
jgi:hypothetical protein